MLTSENIGINEIKKMCDFKGIDYNLITEFEDEYNQPLEPEYMLSEEEKEYLKCADRLLCVVCPHMEDIYMECDDATVLINTWYKIIRAKEQHA